MQSSQCEAWGYGAEEEEVEWKETKRLCSTDLGSVNGSERGVVGSGEKRQER
jgi:hypothetical protein